MTHDNGYGGQGRREDDRGNDNRGQNVPREREGAQARPKAVYAITERGEKTYWTRIGIAYVNRDSSITVRLEAFPVSGALQIRDEELRRERH